LVFFEADAPATRSQLTTNATQQGCFAATGATHNGHYLATRDLHADPFKHWPATIVEAEVFNIDQNIVGQSASFMKISAILAESPANPRKGRGYNQTKFHLEYAAF